MGRVVLRADSKRKRLLAHPPSSTTRSGSEDCDLGWFDFLCTASRLVLHVAADFTEDETQARIEEWQWSRPFDAGRYRASRMYDAAATIRRGTTPRPCVISAAPRSAGTFGSGNGTPGLLSKQK